MNQRILKFSIIFFLFNFLLVLSYVFAGMSFSGGYYTNLCGSGTAANFYSCPADCNPSTGECRGNWVFKFTCDGKLIECRSNRQGPTNYAKVNDPYPGCSKTVQIDVYKKNCLEGGWSCTENDLLGYMVWYSGDCPSQRPMCNTDEITLSVSPNPVRPGGQIVFKIFGDASTWISDDYSGGAFNCTGPWNEKTCVASQQPGTYIWTHYWRKCVGDFNNCSDLCSKSINFKVSANPPTVITKPAVNTL